MKPSEKIREIMKQKGEIIFGEFMPNPKVEAILQYLDENQPCEHKSAYQVESIVGDGIYYNVCNDCGVLFLAHEKSQ